MAALALALAWVLNERDRKAADAPRTSPPAGRASAPRPLPADAVMATPAQARPRLLALLPRQQAGTPQDRLESRLREVCGDRMALTVGDEAVAAALGVQALPTFIFYDAGGKEGARLSGPEAVPRLAAELQARGLAADLLRGEASE